MFVLPQGFSFCATRAGSADNAVTTSCSDCICHYQLPACNDCDAPYEIVDIWDGTVCHTGHAATAGSAVSTGSNNMASVAGSCIPYVPDRIWCITILCDVCCTVNGLHLAHKRLCRWLRSPCDTRCHWVVPKTATGSSCCAIVTFGCHWHQSTYMQSAA